MGEPVSVVKLKNQEDSLYLQIHPQELHFPFELKKQISISFQMSNKSDNYLAFKVKTTIPEKYCVRPNNGVVLPRSTCDIQVTMQAQKKAPPNMHCIDKFLIQSIVAKPGATTEDITSEMFFQDSGYKVEMCKLRVVYDAPPPNLPSPAQASEFDLLDIQAKDQISKLTMEINDGNEKNKKLQQELNIRKRMDKDECCIL
ncbi:putative vesicle-associated membrane-protein-associated protein [Medicago truncatula]|uniref:Putative vesicle-associated membrane-protein-associated protein n=1 Tax=Medicago truncatula TaxID=3880 RepID=G7JH03_MEDTR|nr:vesicle-associated protein 3-1 [Medicago truncatula]AES87406.1 vesicle-associated protein [Medicago truncatula]RHN59335.1 putative vesicle-associated membrane-protein-associated protein [Medicago truncatula]